MLKIRLKRAGQKKKPFYKIVLMKNLSKRQGKHILEFGYYNPLKKFIYINKLLIYKYLNYGCYPTNTVRHLLYRLLQKKINVK
jgi:small subunit ribosomal protein S16